MDIADPHAGSDRRRLVPAAAYVRMSTDKQQYSIDNQTAAIGRYAVRRGYDVIRTYADPGRSGLLLKNREGLKQLLADVAGNQATFSVVLVYDVSRWGRFQDTDESAHYEYLCRRAGIAVEYCAELFANDGSLTSNILKMIKRAMAAEYSRELSVKCYTAQSRMVLRGFKAGAGVGYGLRRLLVDQHGEPRRILQPGEHKALSRDRVKVVAGSPREIATVRWIFEAFTMRGWGEEAIATKLNRRRIASHLGHAWTRVMVRNVVANPAYAGTYVYGRTSKKLGAPRVVNPSSAWVQYETPALALVDKATFDAALKRIDRQRRQPHLSDEQMLDLLREQLAKTGNLSIRSIDAAPGLPTSGSYKHRFGGLLNVYRLVGFTPDPKLMKRNPDHPRRVFRRRIEAELLEQLRALGISAAPGNIPARLLLADRFHLSIDVAHVRVMKETQRQWWIGGRRPPIDCRIILRLDHDQVPIDYLVLPRGKFRATATTWTEQRFTQLSGYRTDSIADACRMVERLLARPLHLRGGAGAYR